MNTYLYSVLLYMLVDGYILAIVSDKGKTY